MIYLKRMSKVEKCMTRILDTSVIIYEYDIFAYGNLTYSAFEMRQNYINLLKDYAEQ